MSKLSSVIRSLALVTLAAACGTTSDAAPAPASSTKAQPASNPDVQAACVEAFTRNRTCTDDYIPALVDLRAKYDQPPGIADDVRANRADVIARAKVEWATDSTDEAIAALCTRLTANATDEVRADLEAARACLAQQDCAAYTSCVMPLMEKRFVRR